MSEIGVSYKCGCEVFDGSVYRCPKHGEPLFVALPYSRPETPTNVEHKVKMAARARERAQAQKPQKPFIKLDPAGVIARDCPITAREYQIAKMIFEGASDRTIASTLEISPNTVRAHIGNIYIKVAKNGPVGPTTTGDLKPRQMIFHWYRRWTMGDADHTKPTVYLYFIQAQGGGDNVKIGISTDPYQRIYHLQVGSPIKLKMLGFIRGGAALEAALHERFKDARLHNEWFAPTDTLMAAIAEMLTTGYLDAA